MSKTDRFSWHVDHIRAALVAALVMAVGMGFGRFAFTGIYPVMVSEDLLTVRAGALAASGNYAGYLVGALLATLVHPKDSQRVCLWALAAMVVCLAAPALLQSPWWIVLIRSLTGVISALIMVSASLWLLQHRGYSSGAPLLYGGVGLGIVLSSELMATGQSFGLRSRGLWLALTVGALILSAIAMPVLNTRSVSDSAQPTAPPSGHAVDPLGAGRLITLYGLAGFGYIITATYLPLIVMGAIGFISPLQIWALFGLGAMPSCFIWHAIHMRLGTRRALFLNLTLQAFGVILPVINPNALGYLGSALIVGGTFMGTATIAMLAARHVAHTIRASILAAMTASFSVGQIVGPLVASALYARSQSFSASLQVAAVALSLAAFLCIRFMAWPENFSTSR
jgi:predicted MFS family arabinose efflux permease